MWSHIHFSLSHLFWIKHPDNWNRHFGFDWSQGGAVTWIVRFSSIIGLPTGCSKQPFPPTWQEMPPYIARWPFIRVAKSSLCSNYCFKCLAVYTNRCFTCGTIIEYTKLALSNNTFMSLLKCETFPPFSLITFSYFFAKTIMTMSFLVSLSVSGKLCFSCQ